MSIYTNKEVRQALKRERLSPDPVFEEMMAHPEQLDMQWQSKQKRNYLYYACGSSVRAVEFFLRYQPINSQTTEQRMPLIKAIYSENTPVIIHLLNKMSDEDIAHQDKIGWTALHCAAINYKEALPLLLPRTSPYTQSLRCNMGLRYDERPLRGSYLPNPSIGGSDIQSYLDRSLQRLIDSLK
jgi:hypothetical protein